jgi:hypothetical protein
MPTQMLIGGAINGSVLALLTLAAPRLTRKLLFAVLVFAAVMYVVFWHAHGSAAWLAVELLGIAFYGAIGARGIKGSAWWLVAGWLAHPVWDIALHYVGPGRSFAPVDYTVPCLTYDIAVAAIVAVAIVSGRMPQLRHAPSA